MKESAQSSKKLRRKSDAKGKGKAVEGGGKKTSGNRIEHLNYKVRLPKQLLTPRIDQTPNSASL